MNGGIPPDFDNDSNTNSSDDDDDDDDDGSTKNEQNDPNFFISDSFNDTNNDFEEELNFEVPYDLHHYKDPEYKLVAAIFDIIQQQLEMEESYHREKNNENDGVHQRRNSGFLNSFNNGTSIDEI